MAVAQNNRPILNRKEWQMMTPVPVTTAAAMFIVSDQSSNTEMAMYVTSNTVQYLYSHNQDAFVQIPSGAIAGTFGAGACGVYHPWSINYTANGGTTTTITVAAGTHNITDYAVGKTVIMLTGTAANLGATATITDVLNNAGTGTITITLGSTFPSAVANTDTFKISTGRFYIMGAGTTAAGSWKTFDVCTFGWQASLSTTGLPASWATDGRLATASRLNVNYESSTATAGGASTLTDGIKTWGVNQWTNYQVRITSGTGIGQVRTIASNTGTVLTTSAAWTTAPDATSVYVIEGNDDYIYLLGNNAVTMYRYVISTNTWSTLAPGVARTAAPSTGMSANHIGITGDTNWADKSAILNGRYIISVRGGASTAIDRYDIAVNTWVTLTYVATETFTTGSSADVDGEFLYIRKDATNRFFRFSVVGNWMNALATNMTADGAALIGSKVWTKNYDTAGVIKWLYSLTNTGTALYRIMLF